LLILVEWCVIVGGQRQSQVMQLVDFGPDEMTNATRSINAEKALQDPLPQVGAKATEGHGTGAAIPLLNWTWVVAGRMPMPTLSLTGGTP
jgi:hypothetical protein